MVFMIALLHIQAVGEPLKIIAETDRCPIQIKSKHLARQAFKVFII